MAKKLIYNDLDELEDDQIVMNLVYNVLDELNLSMQKRADSAPEVYRHFWTEQIDILQNLIQLRDTE